MVKINALIIILVFSFLSGHCEALSMNVTRGSVLQLIRYAAMEGNINVIMDSGIDTAVTVNIRDKSPREAIKELVLAGGFTMTEREGTLFIGQNKRIAGQLGEVHIVPVQYTDLQEIKAEVELYLKNKYIPELKQDKQSKKGEASEEKTGKAKTADGSLVEKPYLADTKGQSNMPVRVMTDVNSRALLVYGTSEEAAAVRDLVEKLDVPARQVALEAKVVAVQRSEAEKLGISWEWTKIHHNFTYEGTLDLLTSSGKARILSKPNIITLQGREAVINIGGEVPIPAVTVTNTTTTTSIEYRPAGIVLKCCPLVNEAGCIESVLHIEVSSPSYVKEMKAYSFQKRSVDTRVRMLDGETLVIGGLISKEEEKQFSKIPFLGDIPVIGKLFQNNSTKTSEEEVMIFIKAWILQ